MHTIYCMARGNGYIGGEAQLPALTADTVLAAAPSPSADQYRVTPAPYTEWARAANTTRPPKWM
jgi:hypothetical protein